MEKKKCKLLSLEEKLNAIEMIDKGISMRKLAKQLGIGRTTLFNAIKNKDKILKLIKDDPDASSKKRLVTTRHPEIEQGVIEYINEARTNSVRITGSSIQSVALETAAQLGFEAFSASNGWLCSFFRRNNINIKDLNEGCVDIKRDIIRPSSTSINNMESDFNLNISLQQYDDDDDNEMKDELILHESDELNVNWRNWCRLCGNSDASSIIEIEHNILEIMSKFFNLSQDEHTKICNNCTSSFQSISELVDRSKLVESMFSELEEHEKENFVSQNDILNIRHRYEIKRHSDALEMIDVKTECNYEEDFQNVEQHENEKNNLLPESDVEWENIEEIEEENRGDYHIQVSKSPEKTVQKSSKSIEQKIMKKSKDEDMFDYYCHICHQTFDRMCFLSNHTRKEHDCLPQVACSCGRFLATWDSLMAHKRKHSEAGEWICDLCNANFITKNGLSIHIKFKHQTQQPLHLCTVCGKEFKDSTTLKSHERTHLPISERYVHECHICQKKFTQKGSLKIHISYVHEGQKSIMCHLCSKSFSSNHYLKIHIQTHQVLNVRCEICDSVFKNKISLKDHQKKIHKPKESLNFPCTVCDRRFLNRNHLERHMPIHTGQRNYRCDFEGCGMAFKWEKDLRNHMSKHNGVRRHKCLWCDRMFVDSANMRKHKLRYHAEALAEFELKYGKRRRMKDLILENDEFN